MFINTSRVVNYTTGEMKMGQYMEILTYNGKEIVYLNMDGLNEADQIKAIDEADKIFSTKKNILNITNVSNTVTTPEVTNKAKELNTKHRPNLKAQAVIGVSGLKRVIAQSMNRGMYFAKDIQDAKDWIIKQ